MDSEATQERRVILQREFTCSVVAFNEKRGSEMNASQQFLRSGACADFFIDSARLICYRR
jgi:hypothetical protein